MRLALISDIHGNYVALEAVLTAISTQHITQVICLGEDGDFCLVAPGRCIFSDKGYQASHFILEAIIPEDFGSRAMIDAPVALQVVDTVVEIVVVNAFQNGYCPTADFIRSTVIETQV